ncbi:MAG: hypothetical protein HDT42_00370 [Ruminococcaceae bacterium]|nr:hypothetical protein [Oscillospiraceae bacterium]
MSAKNLDQKGRLRNKIVALRMSPEENEMLNAAVAISGLTKQDYIINKLLDRTVTIQPNPRVYKALKDKLGEVLAELKRIEDGGEIDDLLEIIRLINFTLNGMKGERE